MALHFCENNEYTDAVIEVLKKDLPESELNVEGCLGRCGECFCSGIAIVNGNDATGDSLDELLEDIRKNLN
jgi:uncharacterized protein YuzB (UPF0349 family)